MTYGANVLTKSAFVGYQKTRHLLVTCWLLHLCVICTRQRAGPAHQVAPATREGVGGSDEGCGEHEAGPELASHEGGQAEPDDAAADDEGGRGVDQGHAKDGRGRQQQQEAHGVAWPEFVGEGTHHQACKDGARDLQGQQESVS